MRTAAFLLLLVFSKVNFIIGLVMTYALPKNHVIQGPVIAFVPFLIAVLVLIFAAPVTPPTTYPFLAGILTTAYLPFSALIYLLAKTYFSAKKSAKG